MRVCLGGAESIGQSRCPGPKLFSPGTCIYLKEKPTEHAPSSSARNGRIRQVSTMSTCQTASKRQRIVGHVITPHHPSLLVSARIGLAEVYTNYRMVDYVAMDLEVYQLSSHSFKNGN